MTRLHAQLCIGLAALCLTACAADFREPGEDPAGGGGNQVVAASGEDFDILGTDLRCEPRDTLYCGSSLVAGSTSKFSTDRLDAYSCFPNGWVPDSPERAYIFDAPYTGEVVFTASHFNAYPQLYVIEDDGTGCNPQSCVRGNYYSVKFQATAGKRYYLVADSSGGITYNYDVSVVCNPPSSETGLCDDRIDNDGDGRIDCNDADCANDPACSPGGMCEPVQEVTCSTLRLPGSTASPNATDEINKYTCTPALQLDRPEMAYRMVIPQSVNEVLVTIGNETDYTVVQVLKDEGGGCDPDTATCVAGNYYNARFAAKPGGTYYVLVEAGPMADSDTVDYELTVICNPKQKEGSPPETCADGLDNDGDGYIDCYDPDCVSICSAGDMCKPMETIDCNTTLLPGSTGAAGSTDAIADYTCGPGSKNLTGSEYTYAFTAPVTGTYNFALSDETWYAGVVVLDPGKKGECDGGLCRKFQWYSNVVDLTGGQTYYVVVDSPGPDHPKFAGPDAVDYSLSVVCHPPYTETDCGDNIDNDGDTYIDCDDPDCNC